MKRDGKQLESLVAFVEEHLVPEGFSVSKNDRVYNEDGVQIAEFDIEIKGKVGSTEISWLIECRDRPSSGPAPGSWIEQLVGRRDRFGFNKVTAVSTTGFAAGAAEYALAKGIEVREVKSLAPDEFLSWLRILHIIECRRLTSLEHAEILIGEESGAEMRDALAEVISDKNGDMDFLISSASGDLVSPAKAFSAVAGGAEGLFDHIEEDGAPVKVQLTANYCDQDHYIVETKLGPVSIKSIVFKGKASIETTRIPLFSTLQYQSVDGSNIISQVASFAPQSIHGVTFSTEMHKISDTGETYVVLRRLDDGP